MGKKKKEQETVIDFGSYTLPTKWEEVTLKQFQEIIKMTKEKEQIDIIDLISIMSNKTKEEVRLLPSEFLDSILARLLFLNKTPECESKNYIIINDEKYQINVLEKLTVGEYVDVNTAIQADGQNYASFLAIMCRKEKEVYDDDFIANKLDERITMYENVSVVEALSTVNFFMALWQTSETLSQASLQEGIENANQLVEQCESLLNAGRGKGYFSIRGIMTRFKLRKFKKVISQLGLTS